MLTIKTVRQLRWNDASNTSLNMLVAFEGSSDTLGEIPFTATVNDTEIHGRELFDRSMAGEFGAIAPYAAPVLTEAQ